MSGNPAVPPPPKALSKGKLAALANVVKDQEAIAKIQQDGKVSIFFDKDGPEVRKRRETARAEFEYIISSIHPEDGSIWSADTITDYTKEYIQLSIGLAKGRIEEKPRADVMFQKKEAIYWWAVRMIPNFSKIFITWHHLVNAHIGFVALQMGLSKAHREKNNITDMEMDILFDLIMSKTSSVPNYKQHYVAWLLVWITSIRPGSFTVCPGYRAGDGLGIEGMVREIDETLRFSHCTFLRVDNGITVQIEFEFNKGQRNPYTRKLITTQRKFTFLPCTGNRYHLDISTLLVALGLERGLFTPVTTYDGLLKVETLIIPKDSSVDSQAVFIASDVGRNVLLPEKAMREAALNPVLRAATFEVGLWSRNTIYSLRRTAILETRRSEGTELARQVAGHTMGSKAILAYDNVGLADLDIVAVRLGEDNPRNRAEIRELWAQAKVSRVDIVSTLQIQMAEYVDEKMRADEQFIAAEHTLQDCLEAIWVSSDIDQKTMANALAVVGDGIEDSQEASVLKDNLESAMKTRKEVRKSLRRKLTEEFKKTTLENFKKSVKALTTKSGATHLHGALPGSVVTGFQATTSSSREDIDTHAVNVEQTIQGLKAANNEADQELEDGAEEVDSEAVADHLEGEGGNQSSEPDQWAAFGEGDVEVTGDAVQTASGETRASFTRRFLLHRDVAVKDKKCMLCQLDDTCSYDEQNLVYLRKEDLDRHLRSIFHSVAAQKKRTRDDK